MFLKLKRTISLLWNKKKITFWADRVKWRGKGAFFINVKKKADPWHDKIRTWTINLLSKRSDQTANGFGADKLSKSNVIFLIYIYIELSIIIMNNTIHAI